MFVYSFEGLTPWNRLTDWILSLADAAGLSAITSELTLAQCLTKPLRTGNVQAVEFYLSALRSGPALTVVPVDREVQVESARLRALLTSLRTPDAIHAATAQLAECDYFVTNDTQLRLPERAPKLALLAELEL